MYTLFRAQARNQLSLCQRNKAADAHHHGTSRPRTSRGGVSSPQAASRSKSCNLFVLGHLESLSVFEHLYKIENNLKKNYSNQ